MMITIMFGFGFDFLIFFVCFFRFLVCFGLVLVWLWFVIWLAVIYLLDC